MKRGNPNMSKPSLGRINYDLGRYKCNTKSTKSFTKKCKRCGEVFTFYEKDLKDQVIKCPNCGEEEIFFACNYLY